MWSDEQRQHFQSLRTRERQQKLTDAEKVELARFIQELEEEESSYLRPANQRLDERIRRTQEQNRVLRTLVRRQRSLIRRMERLLADSQTEQQSINNEVQRILAEQPLQVRAGS